MQNCRLSPPAVRSHSCILGSLWLRYPALQASHLLLMPSLLFLLCFCIGSAGAQDVLTHHYSNDRLGVQSLETSLTPSNVNSTQFGKLFSFPVQGDVYAQPLFVKQYTMKDGKAHNVLFVATQEDYVYAFDADGNNPSQGYLWRASLLKTGETYLSNNDVGTEDITPNIGITGTPVIDRAQGALYVVAKSKTTGGNTQFIQRLHALKLSDGTEILNGPTTIEATANGTGDGSNTVSFNSLTQNQRPALLLASTPNGTSTSTVFIGWASHGDQGVYHGWIIGYNAADISKQVGVWNDTPNGSEGGIWMSAGGIAADGKGNLFAATGNGTFDADSGKPDFGNSALRLALSGSTLAETDYFSPANQGSLNGSDSDMGTGGIILLPDQSGSTPHLAITTDKLGSIYLLNRDNMGKYNGSANTSLQSFDTGGYSVHNTPAFFNNTLYLGVDGGPIEAWALNSSTTHFNTTPQSSSGNIFGCYHCNGSGSTVSISANGTANGIVWALDNSGYGNSSAVLYAYDAANLSELYDSNQAGSGRDSAAIAVKFTTPTIANGHVYVGGRDAVTVYGILGSAPPTAATPTFSPAPGTYASSQAVTISDAQSGVTIYYTTDGSVPSTSSKVYSSPIQVSASTTIKAMAVATSYENSPVATATYTISPSASQQIQVPLAQYANTYGIYTDGTSFSTGGLDGNGYAYSATYLGTSLTYSGITYALGIPNQQNVVRGINAPVIELPSGSYVSLNFLATGVNGDQTSQTFTITYTDGTSSIFTQDLSDWGQPRNYTGESTALSMYLRNRMDGVTIGGISNVYQYSFTLNPTKTVKSLTMPDNESVALLAITLVANPGAVTPALTFSPTPGTYAAPLTVTISDSQRGATIYYTTDGSTPSTSSKVYSGPIQVSTSSTVKALAKDVGYPKSPVTTATYIIGGSPSQQVQVPLAPYANTYGIYTDGTSFDTGGLDGAGYAYSANLLGTSLTRSGVLYLFGTPNQKNVVRGINAPVIDLSSGRYSSLNLLATGVNGNQSAQTFTVAYTDGTTSTFTQGLSDWQFPVNFGGESVASVMDYRDQMDGGMDSYVQWYLYEYSFALDPAKTVKSLTMPDNSNVALLAITLVANPVTSTTPPPTFSPAPGTYTAPQVVTLSDSQSGAIIYYTTDGSTPKVYSGPIQVSERTTLMAMATTAGYYDSPVTTATYTISPPTTQQVQVPLARYANTYGIYWNSSKFGTGGLDTNGYAYSANLLGDSLTYAKITYAFGAPNQQNVVRGINAPVIGLPTGSYAFLNLLATSIKGNQTSQTFTVTYTDGTSSNFTRDISDWGAPQYFIGESIASTMSYRVYRDGNVDDSHNPSLYQYSFALDRTKTVKSLTMPDNGNVALLAITLASNPVQSTTPAPTFSPVAGTYTPPQTVTIADSHSGAIIYYTTDGSTPTTLSKVYSGPIQLWAPTTLKAIATSTGYENSSVATASYIISLPATQQVQVPLAQYANAYGIYTDGSKFTTGGLDTDGYAYSASLLGTSLIYSGIKYTFGTPNQENAVRGSNAPVIELPKGAYISLNFLGTGVNGEQHSQIFTVTYTDGTSSIFIQDLSDWGLPGDYSGQSIAAMMSYRNYMDGSKDDCGCQLYQYSFTLDTTKTVKSLTMPDNSNVVLLAITLVADAVTPKTPAPTFSPAPGTYTAPQTVTISDAQSGATIYYTTDGSTPSTSSKIYSEPIRISASTTIKAMAAAAGYENSSVATANYKVNLQWAPPEVQVPLAQYANTYGVYTDGTTFTSGGLDGGGDAYSANLLGSSLTHSGIAYKFGTANQPNAIRGTHAPIIGLKIGRYSSLNLLATAVNGNQPSQTFIVTYTDGTTARFEQSISDWYTPQNYTGESIAKAMPYHNYSSGEKKNGTFNLYQYSFALDPTKTVKSLTMPDNSDVALLAITLVSSQTRISLSAFANAAGIYTDGTQFSTGGINGHNEALSSHLLGDLLTYEGVTYGFEIANQKNVVRGQLANSIPIPSRRYTSLNFLAVGVNGNQPWQAFTITYTDGTKSTFLQSVSDWHQPRHYRGESVALQMNYFNTGDGGRDPNPANIYAYSFELNSKKTVKSLTIPQNHNVVLLAVTLE